MRWRYLTQAAGDLVRDEAGEEGDVGQERDADSGEGGESEAVQEDETQDGALLAVGLGGGAGDNNAGLRRSFCPSLRQRSWRRP